MAGAPPVPNAFGAPRTGNAEVDKALGKFFASLQRLLLAPFLRGNWVQNVPIAVGLTAVPHGLGRLPRGYLVTRVRSETVTSSSGGGGGGSSNTTGGTITATDANTLLYWTCDEVAGSTTLHNTGSGTLADLTIAGAGYAPKQDTGLFTNATFLFRDAGSNTKYWVSGSSAPVPANVFTLSCWVKPKAFVGAGYALASRPSGGVMNALGWGVNGSDLYPQFYHQNPGGGSYFLQYTNVASEPSAQCRLAQDAWNHLAVTWDGTTLSLYCNGQLAASSTPASAPFGGITSTIWALGADPAGTISSTMDAWVDDVRVETTCRSQAYLLGLYNTAGYGIPGGGSWGPVFYSFGGLFDSTVPPDNRVWYFNATSAAVVDLWFFP